MSAKLKIVLTGILLFLQIYLCAQEKTENIIKQDIPDSLTKGADVVCRLAETTVEIKTPGKIIVHERNIYTILHDGGSAYGNFTVSYTHLTLPTIYSV